MNNEITLTVEGWVARSPQHHGRDGSTWVTLRVGSTAWWWDSQGERRDTPTTWFDVKISQKDLAENVLLSIKSGDAVIVTGRLSQHYWTDRDGKDRTSMQITAKAVGHNLRWGKASWCRRSAEPVVTDPDAGGAGPEDTSAPSAGGDSSGGVSGPVASGHPPVDATTDPGGPDLAEEAFDMVAAAAAEEEPAGR
ncbi:MAG: single-stranded DNA-binding protein [Propionibacteriaceae bacterium]|jgi:single-strand DNA-binding protein|nr:single-stranded DNA-binding protein [Propionibacteriaceae bacterium]